MFELIPCHYCKCCVEYTGVLRLSSKVSITNPLFLPSKSHLITVSASTGNWQEFVQNVVRPLKRKTMFPLSRNTLALAVPIICVTHVHSSCDMLAQLHRKYGLIAANP